MPAACDNRSISGLVCTVKRMSQTLVNSFINRGTACSPFITGIDPE